MSLYYWYWSPGGHFTTSPIYVVTTDATGKFEFDDLILGVFYTVVAARPDGETGASNFRSFMTPFVFAIMLPLPPAQLLPRDVVAVLSWGIYTDNETQFSLAAIPTDLGLAIMANTSNQSCAFTSTDGGTHHSVVEGTAHRQYRVEHEEGCLAATLVADKPINTTIEEGIDPHDHPAKVTIQSYGIVAMVVHVGDPVDITLGAYNKRDWHTIEGTTSTIIDVFTYSPDDGGHVLAYQIFKPANCNATTTDDADECLFYADTDFDPRPDADYVWRTRGDQNDTRILRMACARAAPDSDGATLDLHPAQLYLSKTGRTDTAVVDAGGFHLSGTACNAKVAPETDPIANFAWPINVDGDSEYVSMLESIEVYSIGVEFGSDGTAPSWVGD